MIVFWLAALAMLAVALALVIPPIAVARDDRGPTRDQVRRAMYREQLRDLEAQRDAGSLDADSFAQAREELGREFLEHETGADEAPPAPPSAHPYRAAIVAVLIPVAATGMYLSSGTPGVLLDDTLLSARPEAAPHPGESTAASVEQMVASLEERLRREPGDAEGWVMLARSYQFMERPGDARRVLEQALAHHPNDPVVLVHLAEATATLNGNNLDDAAMDYVNRALEAAPDFPRALWLAGIHALNQGDAPGALARWERVLQVAELAPGARAQIEQAIADARQRAGTGAGAPEGGAATAGAASVEVTVTLADTLAAKLDGGETLFVFARASQGPPMPLAVRRLGVDALPVTVVLDDSHAMAPELRLSRFDPVVVTARISRSGSAQGQSGDLQGISTAVSPADHPKMTVVIDQVVQ